MLQTVRRVKHERFRKETLFHECSLGHAKAGSENAERMFGRLLFVFNEQL